LFVVEVGLERTDRRSVHRELVPLILNCSRLRMPRRSREAVVLAEEVLDTHSARLRAAAAESCRERFALIAKSYSDSVRASAQRERDIATASPSAARRLVQVGLFDARESNAMAARRRTASLALLDVDDRLADLSPDEVLRTTARVVAIRLGWDLPS
jgi:hypothetical protein